jgi:UDP-N-acetylglucosamine acyltransferase|tara:strand:- start:11297 stop:12088 length:792 start_codon:yes stop_codon:yes gene_type:complete
MKKIHPTAIIDSKAEILDNVEVGAYSVIDSAVTIGAGTKILNHVSVTGNTTLGSGNTIFPFSVIGTAPQDISYRGEPTSLIIGDRNVIRENCTLNVGTVRGKALTEIGSDNLIMAYSHIAHDCQLGNNILMANGAQLAGHVLIEDFATLGGFSLIHQFVRIGRNSFTSMGSAVNKDLPPYCLASGNYARAIGLNRVGLRRFGMSSDTIDALSKVFRLMILSRQEPDENELSELSVKFPEVAKFISFVRNTKRGIIRTHLKART